MWGVVYRVPIPYVAERHTEAEKSGGGMSGQSEGKLDKLLKQLESSVATTGVNDGITPKITQGDNDDSSTPYSSSSSSSVKKKKKELKQKNKRSNKKSKKEKKHKNRTERAKEKAKLEIADKRKLEKMIKIRRRKHRRPKRLRSRTSIS